VQTVASTAGTLSSIIFVLPGMVMIGWWTGFPYWVSFGICVFGGILGVMYSIPLRRALVSQSDLPYPEGVACAEVLKVGSGEHGSGIEESRAGLSALLWGSVVSGAFSLITATRIFASDVSVSAASRATTSCCHSRCSASATSWGCGWAWRCCLDS
jgi:putative OPT family oligopeptide transporter